MRSISKNKALLCFRPVVDIDVMLEPKSAADRPPSRRFSCFPVEEKNGMKVSETKTIFLDKGSIQKLSENSIANPPPKRTLSRVIKAVIFEMILNRRANQKNRYLGNSYGTKRSYSTNTETSSTGSTCLSEATESRNLPKSYATGAKRTESSYQAPIEKQKNWDCTGIYLLVISLAVTILWGKILGIIITSIWLCFQSRPAASYRRPQEVAKLAKTGSKVYNKKRGHNGRTARKLCGNKALLGTREEKLDLLQLTAECGRLSTV
ncbi:hypothetical protein L6164_018784 [Bauhinia variegata]|uniref:Uncharacterized protein n=1 Tax=Bauhinia variegata TaxID=167791 RepID=A0ACB9NDJ1_BAUVA|nr:hypothetical protein L6164_018784 [Bauhinia variegata]